MKKTAILLLAILIAVNFSSCKNEDETVQNSVSESEQTENSEPVEKDEISERGKIETPLLSEDNTYDTLDIYRYFSNGNIYEHLSVDFESKDKTILAVIDEAVSVLDFVKEPLPIKSVQQNKNLITVNFDYSFIDTYSKYEIDELRNTIGMTLLRNNIGDNYLFTLDGDENILGGYFRPADLKVAKADPEECRKLTDTVPYEHLDYSEYNIKTYENTFGKTPDKVEAEIFNLLKVVGKLEGNAASPNELDRFSMFYGLISNTNSYYTDKSYGEYENERYVPQLMPITDSVSSKTGTTENMIWIYDHLIETAKIVYGDDFRLDMTGWNADISPWIYFPDENVVVPPHMGGGYETLPFVKTYEDNDGIVTAEIVYLFGSMSGISLWGEDVDLSSEEINKYVNTTENVAEVTMKREKDGRLVFASAQLNKKEN